MFRPLFLLLAALAVVCGASLAQDAHMTSLEATPLDTTSQAWAAPVAPFRIADNLYYVGASEVTAYAIATRQGLILIDGGFAQTAPQIVANLHTLGFDIRDVRIILATHAHYDHVGAIAELKRLSGARLYVSAGDAGEMARGGRGDFAFGDRFRYPPVEADHILADREIVRLGQARLTANITPGHTRGCTSWTMPVRIGAQTLSAVIVCSITAPGYRLVGNAAYPNIIADFRATFTRLSAMRCDIPLGSHGSFFNLDAKRRRLAARPPGDPPGPPPGNPPDNPPDNPFVDPAGCRGAIERAHAAFEAEVARQRGGEAH